MFNLTCHLLSPIQEHSRDFNPVWPPAAPYPQSRFTHGTGYSVSGGLCCLLRHGNFKGVDRLSFLSFFPLSLPVPLSPGSPGQDGHTCTSCDQSPISSLLAVASTQRHSCARDEHVPAAELLVALVSCVLSFLKASLMEPFTCLAAALCFNLPPSASSTSLFAFLYLQVLAFRLSARIFNKLTVTDWILTVLHFGSFLQLDRPLQ